MSSPPSLRRERQLLREIVPDFGPDPIIAGIDEVGRGALAGPVTVGVVLVNLSTSSAPVGVRDSKLLSATQRIDLVPRIQGWGVARGVGHASNLEIDALGISSALALAALRAIKNCGRRPDAVLLDGRYDWLSPSEDLFSQLCGDDSSTDTLGKMRAEVLAETPVVHTVIGGDLACSSIAAASVLAKVARDQIMADLAAQPAHAPFGWESNKGYGSAQHLTALRTGGACLHHRRSWNFACAPNLIKCGASSFHY